MDAGRNVLLVVQTYTKVVTLAAPRHAQHIIAVNNVLVMIVQVQALVTILASVAVALIVGLFLLLSSFFK